MRPGKDSIMEETPYHISYEFSFGDGKRNVFEILLDPKTVSIIRTRPNFKPEWARLESNQCRCCPLGKESQPYCPIALNIADLIEEYKDMISVDRCIVRCTTPARTYLKETSIQEGLFSILGIIMATSNCPVMEFFKPMARFHLPFSTLQETVFRSTSIYLLKQYFAYKKGHEPDMNLEKLAKYYKKIQMVNEGILGRISDIVTKDASKNALVILYSLSQILSMNIEGRLNSIEHLFGESGIETMGNMEGSGIRGEGSEVRGEG